MKILYLYKEVMGYTLSTIKTLVQKGVEVHVVCSDKNKQTPYKIPNLKNVYFYSRSKYTKKSLIEMVNVINPQISVVSGWVDKGYLHVAKNLRSQGKIVVCGLDGQWHSNPKQWLGYLLSKFGFFLNYFSHAWVAGIFQYEYAKKLGFSKKKIIYDLYSCDLKKFSASYKKNLKYKNNNYPRRFLYVGRYEQIKGLDILIEAWKSIYNERKGWELHFIGNGTLENKLKETSEVIVKSFMQPDKLLSEIADSGCFVLPSKFEPWGVVVHEFAAAGLPIIASDSVGSASAFVINGYNGYKYSSQNVEQLKSCLKKIIKKKDSELLYMAKKSNEVSKRISPETSANNLLSIL